MAAFCAADRCRDSPAVAVPFVSAAVAAVSSGACDYGRANRSLSPDRTCYIVALEDDHGGGGSRDGCDHKDLYRYSKWLPCGSPPLPLPSLSLPLSSSSSSLSPSSSSLKLSSSPSSSSLSLSSSPSTLLPLAPCIGESQPLWLAELPSDPASSLLSCQRQRRSSDCNCFRDYAIANDGGKNLVNRPLNVEALELSTAIEPTMATAAAVATTTAMSVRNISSTIRSVEGYKADLRSSRRTAATNGDLDRSRRPKDHGVASKIERGFAAVAVDLVDWRSLPVSGGGSDALSAAAVTIDGEADSMQRADLTKQKRRQPCICCGWHCRSMTATGVRQTMTAPVMRLGTSQPSSSQCWRLEQRRPGLRSRSRSLRQERVASSLLEQQEQQQSQRQQQQQQQMKQWQQRQQRDPRFERLQDYWEQHSSCNRVGGICSCVRAKDGRRSADRVGGGHGDHDEVYIDQRQYLQCDCVQHQQRQHATSAVVPSLLHCQSQVSFYDDKISLSYRDDTVHSADQVEASWRILMEAGERSAFQTASPQRICCGQERLGQPGGHQRHSESQNRHELHQQSLGGFAASPSSRHQLASNDFAGRRVAGLFSSAFNLSDVCATCDDGGFDGVVCPTPSLLRHVLPVELSYSDSACYRFSTQRLGLDSVTNGFYSCDPDEDDEQPLGRDIFWEERAQPECCRAVGHDDDARRRRCSLMSSPVWKPVAERQTSLRVKSNNGLICSDVSRSRSLISLRVCGSSKSVSNVLPAARPFLLVSSSCSSAQQLSLESTTAAAYAQAPQLQSPSLPATLQPVRLPSFAGPETSSTIGPSQLSKTSSLSSLLVNAYSSSVSESLPSTGPALSFRISAAAGGGCCSGHDSGDDDLEADEYSNDDALLRPRRPCCPLQNLPLIRFLSPLPPTCAAHRRVPSSPRPPPLDVRPSRKEASLVSLPSSTSASSLPTRMRGSIPATTQHRHQRRSWRARGRWEPRTAHQKAKGGFGLLPNLLLSPPVARVFTSLLLAVVMFPLAHRLVDPVLPGAEAVAAAAASSSPPSLSGSSAISSAGPVAQRVERQQPVGLGGVGGGGGSMSNGAFGMSDSGQNDNGARSKYISFSDPTTERFIHQTMYDHTGHIYVGAVNKIYQLDENLELVSVATMGPQEDDPWCPVTRQCPTIHKKPIDYYNKVLVIDYVKPQLVSCGSLFQGVCSVHQLDNVAEYRTPAHESVVANNATASTVGFIGKGPNNQRVLYVGVSYTNNGPYRSDVPAVSSRSLDLKNNTFNIAVTGVSTGTRVSVNSLAREFFPIHYVFGFTSKDFSYLLTVQKKETERPFPYISKLVRVCQRDVHYYSYTEVALVCRAPDGVDYNLAQAGYVGKPGSELAVSLGISAQDDVLFAVFAKSADDGDDSHNKPTRMSALCVYALSAVHRKFTQNIHHCFNGHGQRGLDFINPSQPCQLTQVQISDDFCGMEVNTPLDGAMAIEASPVLSYPSTLLTAVSAVSTHDYTVAFLGTSDGHLKKVVVESVTKAFEYADILLDVSKAVQPDMLFDRDHKYIYVMTEKKISKVNVQECAQQYRTCVDCLDARDPYCGWCSLENKCSLRSDCAQAAQDPLYWLSYKSGRCTTITDVQPAEIQRTTARILTLKIGNLPNLDGSFRCVFTTLGKTLETNATRTATGVQCATPHTDSLPPIVPGEHHFTAKLSVRMRDNPDFVATNFTFYDCSTYLSCTECVSGPFPCDWCVGGHRCTHDTGENCRNDVLITGVVRFGPSIRSGPDFCPRINSTNNIPELLVPMGIRKRIQVRVEQIPQFLLQTKFVCQFNIEGRVKQVVAQRLDDTIYCDEVKFIYNTKEPNITTAFAVVWDSLKPLDNPDNVHVLVYRCAAMSTNCGMCLELDEKYNCGWCQESNSCEVQDQCHKHTVKWLERTQTCPDPQITRVTPSSGPLDGGTNITIDGFNLGRVFSDIDHGIYIDVNERERIACKPHPNQYVKTTRIVCELDTPAVNKSQAGSSVSGHVVVKVLGDYIARSSKPFSFVNPRITSINPSKGPMSGGTKLRVWGLHMDAGSHAEAFVGAMPCEIISRKPNVVECITSASKKNEEGRVRLQFDRGLKIFEDYGFLYVADPEVHQVESGGTASGTGSYIKGAAPRGIPSGGISVIVKGTHLNSVQEPMMYIALDGVEYYSKCAPESSTEMKCRTPTVPAEQLNFSDDEEFIELEYGFKMDNVKGVRHLSSTKGFPKFQMYPDPIYNSFSEEGGIKYYKSDYLTINGANLDRASQESDVVVRIGAGYCNVTSLSRTQLTCRPPTEQPAALDDSGHIDRSRIPQVIVEVGDTLKYQIGMLSYDAPHGHDNQLSRPVVIGVICGGVVLIIIVIGILIAYRRKSTESSRVLKTMQEQMDVLELRVASECKEAFAELQTEMTDLTSDLTAGGIPFLDYRTYTMKVLFPNAEDHPVLKEMQVDPVKKQYMEKGLRMFGQLIMSKTFLLLFIRTLESNRYFSMRDRVQVASLIMVTLQGKMEYCTDILKTLLADLIEKCIDGKSHPKLLLRRTESVAEKMLSAWFTFLLYKFLRECAGEPLFVLFRAIKQQVDKGPVDAVTGEARYSLSEEKLIRQSVDYKSITAYFSIAPHSYYMSVGMIDAAVADGQEIPVRVLDCDTISQVKEKGLDAIYKNTPASHRPCKDDLDLEWRTGTSGRLILSDEDATTKSEGEWRRLNTLAHYKVPDGANLILVPRQSSTYNLSIASEKMTPAEKTLYHKYETLNFTAGFQRSPPMSRATSPPLHGLSGLGDLEGGGFKYWHLVRHADADKDERGNKMVSEIYLTRLLATKGTLQKFVDDLFETIFSTAHRGSALPLAIKYMFDFLDDQALQHGIQDHEVVHTWKSNSLPLRFWVNLIKNPNFVFDTNKSNIVDSCLSVVAQTFMDACSTSDHRLGKDSPSSKLLYAKDIPAYKNLVEHYYANIRVMPQISEEHMNAMLGEESRLHAHEFNTNVALNELYKYAAKYTDQLIQTLEEDEFAQKNRLAWRLSQVNQIMRGETDA